ncbi:unnamed protein product [Orchesella dallaii]|uniref:Death domain-containing protein n=1 Tax=Orchesella dallaii TaxID=48710 RepID=A0ABP1RCT1_9HEXA
MEVRKREHIIRNIAKLISITDCNDLVIGNLRQHLSDWDVQCLEIKRTNGGQISQSKKFYDIMVMKVNSYDDLITVLEQEKQQGAANILKQIKQGEKCRGGGVTQPPKSQPQQTNICDDLLVGKDPPCTFIRVRDVMSRSGGQVWRKLMDLAASLEIPDDDLHALMQRENTSSGKLLEILQSWRSEKSSHATLGNLITALKNNNLKLCADALREEFAR